MARPKTAAADYVPVTFRMPKELLEKVKQCGDRALPVNTKLVRLVSRAIDLEATSTPHEATDRVRSGQE